MAKDSGCAADSLVLLDSCRVDVLGPSRIDEFEYGTGLLHPCSYALRKSVYISFEAEKEKANKAPDITDIVGKEVLFYVPNADQSTIQTMFEIANKERLGTLEGQHKAAHIYLALGLRQLEKQDIAVRIEGKTVTPARFFHFAGHAFRGIGQLNRAADAYWRAGVANGKNVDDFAIRSLVRAKMTYAEIGETDKADQIHVLEWEAKRMLANSMNRVLLFAWRSTTAYGTSARRWALWLIVTLASFSVLYQVLHFFKGISEAHTWTWGISAIYFCIVTTATVGYGDFTPANGIAEAVVILNIIIGYVMLAFGATILGRKVIGR